MRGRRLTLVVAAALAGFTASVALADPATQEAVKQDAKAFAKGLIPGVASVAKTQPTADSVPGYGSGTPSQASYYKNPDALKSDAQAQASANQGYSFVRNSIDQRPKVDQTDLDATVSRSMAIQNDPTGYVSGFSAGGTNGNCHALPPGSGSPGTYEQSCNTGYGAGDAVTRSCQITLDHQFTSAFGYSCTNANYFSWYSHKWEQIGQINACPGLPALGCTRTSSTTASQYTQGTRLNGRIDTTTETYTCPTQVNLPAPPGLDFDGHGVFGFNPVPQAPVYTGPAGYQYQGSTRNDSQCSSLPGDGVVCDQPTEVCTDASPQTRVINGVSITQACWAWTRTWQCRALVPTNDCGQLAAQGCTFSRRQCLTDETPCLTYEDVYSCPIPGNDTSNQYICDGDVYCINGDCETIDRTPNTEFGQAAAALNSVAQAGRELDPNSLKIFQGERDTCSKTIAGLTNCCAPRGLPIVGGGCDAADKVLKQKKDKGLCHYVGSYCSTKVLGICLKKKEADCCYLSKLSRIIQEQGRPQLGLDFGTAKNSICDGFTVDQFSHLDLSRIDFSEVMADFVNAAKLPDDLQTANSMQAKIQAYYTNHN